MARVVESTSKKPVRDVREFEERRVLTLVQAQRLEIAMADIDQRAVAEAPDVRNVYAIRTLLRTGLRRFEFCKLRCGDIEGDKLRVVGKGNIKDYVPLFPAASRTLSRWLEIKAERGEKTGDRSFLFLGRGEGPLSFSTLRLAWKDILHRAGLADHYGLHTLRHTAGLIVYAQTADLAKTARFLRHTDVKTTAEFYLHVDPDELRAALAKVQLWR